jgi:hypothetical protein
MISLLSGLALMTGVAYADDDFIDACEAEAADRGQGGTGVCACMVDEAGGDQDIIDELMESMSESDLDARRALLSDEALEVVTACAPA